MFGIRLRFMDLLYAAVIGNSLQLLNPETVNAKFVFGLFLLVVILEDFFLYYADVAPENPDAQGLSFLGMVTEISVLASWCFAFQAFIADQWIFLVFLMIFFLLKTWAGFINCLVSHVLMSLKFGRELMFLVSVAALAWFVTHKHDADPANSPALLLWIAGTWVVQTVAWWAITKFFRAREGKQAVLSLATAPHFAAAPVAETTPAESAPITVSFETNATPYTRPLRKSARPLRAFAISIALLALGAVSAILAARLHLLP
jgi:hypothetical protein